MKNRPAPHLLVFFTFVMSSAINILAQTPQLVPLTSFGTNGNGSILPDERTYLTSVSTLQRGMAYNRSTGHLLIANRSPISAPTINIVDGVSGADLGAMAFSELVAAGNTSFKLNKIAVADDGAVYVANLTTASTALVGFVLYRYANESSEQTVVFAGDPSNGAAPSSSNSGRWGDTMVVRGTGTNTQILISSQGNLLAILRPTDETMTAFTATTLTADSSLVADSLSFGVGNTFWRKAGNSTLRRMSFDLNAGTATTLQTYPSTVFPTRIGPILEITSSNLFAGIENASGPDYVKLYDISTITTPVFLDRETYTTNGTATFTGEISVGDGRLYALNSDSGIRAFGLMVTNELVSPSFITQPASQFGVIGSNVTFSSAADGIPAPSYQWFFNQTNLISGATNNFLTLSNLAAGNAGFYSVVGSNSAGSATSSIVALVIVADPNLYVYEPFNYPVGQKVTDFSVGPGQFWITNGATANDTLIASTNLTVTGLATSTGNSITNGGVGAAARLAIGASQNSGSVYASFAMKIDQLGSFGAAAGLLASFVDSAPNTQAARLAVIRDGAGFKLGIGKVVTAGVFNPTVFTEGQQFFIVVRYTFVSGANTNDQADLWINPAPGTFALGSAPAPTVSALITGTDTDLIDMWAFRQNTAVNTPSVINYDELRIGRTWASVTPLAVADAINLSIGRSGNSDVIISWPTTGSSGYILERATAFANPTVWNVVPEATVVSGSTNFVTITPTNVHSFFRLKK